MSGQTAVAGRGYLVATRVLVAVSFLVAAYGLMILTTFAYGRDQGIYAVVSEAILQGGAPYRDAWDFKPPLVYFIYASARALLGTDMHSIRLVEAGALASLLIAFAVLSRRALGDWRAGALSGALAIILHVRLEFWHTAQPESFGGVATAWALVCATFPRSKSGGRDGRAVLAWVASGALYTVAAFLKPPLGGGFVVSLVFVLFQQLRGVAPGDRFRVAARVALAFGLGATLVIASVLSFFLAKGALGDLYQTFFVLVPRYTALGFEPVWLPLFVWRAAAHALTAFSLAIPIGLLLLAGLGARRKGEVALAMHALGIVFFQILGIALQAKFFDYHYGATLPLLALLAGWGFWKLWSRLKTAPRRTSAALVLIASGLLIVPARPPETGLSRAETLRIRSRMLVGEAAQADVDRVHTMGDVSFGANRLVARWLAKRASPDDHVFIWGFEPMVYDMAARRPASRYIYNVPQRLDWPGRGAARGLLLRDLAETRPEVIVVLRNDALPKVVGDQRDSAGALRGFSELGGLIEANYRLEETIEDFMIYGRTH